MAGFFYEIIVPLAGWANKNPTVCSTTLAVSITSQVFFNYNITYNDEQ